MMGWFGNGYGYGGWSGVNALGMGLMMVLVWGSVIGFGIWLLARITRTEHPQPSGLESPRAMLDRRFAAGELDAEQYANARRLIDSK
ncbi:MAG: SHOCT domain-containing protein [Candidatus Nanopelagicales bacterium]